MKPGHLVPFSKILSRHLVEFLIVGGGAVRQFYPSEPQDVDLLLMSRKYEAAVRALEQDPDVESFSWESRGLATGYFRTCKRLVRFDLIDPGAFSGNRSGDQFFEYVSDYGSVSSKAGRVATVPVVWYMRLALEGEAWTAHVPKIIRDIQAGAPWSFQKSVRRIARRFGTLTRVDERLRLVRTSAVRGGLLAFEDRASNRVRDLT